MESEEAEGRGGEGGEGRGSRLAGPNSTPWLDEYDRKIYCSGNRRSNAMHRGDGGRAWTETMVPRAVVLCAVRSSR